MELLDNNGVSKTNEEGESVIVLGNKVPDNYWHCLMLPQNAKRKERMEAIGGLFAEMMQTESLNKPKHDVDTTENKIPIEYAHALRAMGRVIGYMLNSTSWDDGILYDYDKDVLIRRVKQIHFNR